MLPELFSLAAAALRVAANFSICKFFLAAINLASFVSLLLVVTVVVVAAAVLPLLLCTLLLVLLFIFCTCCCC